MMAHFFLRSICRSPFSFLARLGVAGFLALAGMLPPVQAEPVTFRFEAEIRDIGQVRQPDFNLPFDVEVGDRVSGMLVLLDDDGFAHNTRPVDISFEIGGTTLVSENYILGVLDGISETLNPIIVDRIRVGPLEVNPPALLRMVDTGLDPLRDMAILFVNESASFPLVQFAPDRLAEAPDVFWQPVITLEGSDGILSEEAVPLEESVFNAFSTRTLQLAFEVPVSGQAGGAIIISSDILGFRRVIPEPGAVWTAAPLLVVGCMFRWRRPQSWISCA